MTDFSRKFDATRQYIEGDGVPTYTTLSGTTEEFSADVDLTTHESVHVEVEVTFETTPADDVDVNVYPSDDSTYDGEEISVMSFRVLKKDNDARYLSFDVSGYAHFRLGFVQTVGTDTANKVRAWHKRAKWTDA